MILSSVVMGRTAVVYGVPAIIAVSARPAGRRSPAACSTASSSPCCKLPPFIVTLGTWSIFGALNIFYSRSETIRSQDIEAGAPFLQWTGSVIKLYDFVLTRLASSSPG